MNSKNSVMRGSDIENASEMIKYLKHRNVGFSADGFPVMDDSWFLATEPDEILPFYNRRYCRNKKKTCICFNSNDENLYPRISSILNDLPIYREYMGVMPMDISVSRYMLLETQKFNLLLNALFLSILGINGIKFAAPLRFGSMETISLFKCYEKAPIGAIGSIGTRRNRKEDGGYEECALQLLRLLFYRNRKMRVLVYGDVPITEIRDWRKNNVFIRSYCDFQKRSRERSKYE